MSSSATGFGSWKKGGRVSDASAVTQNIRVVAQGQADATYASTQKKNPFRLSSAILNGGAYGGQTLSRANIQNVDRYYPVTFDAFAGFPSLFQVNGDADATVIPNTVTLVPNVAGKHGSAFCKIPIHPNSSFVARAIVHLSNYNYQPADGFGVGLVNDPTWVGDGGRQVGLIKEDGPASAGILVRFTTFAFGDKQSGLLDTAGNPYAPEVNLIDNVRDALVAGTNPFSVTITYDKAAASIRWNLSEMSGTHYQSFGPLTGIDLNQLLGGSNVYLGVGGGTGGSSQRVDLIGLTFANSP